MKITFPQMGNLKIPVRAFLQELGWDVVIPPVNSKKTLDLGVRHSPEFACLPLKLNVGNFIEAVEMGAELLIMGGGCGPCRFGYYCEVEREILEELGYRFEMLVLEPGLKRNLGLIERYLGSPFSSSTLKRLYRAGRLAWEKTEAMDEIERLVLEKRAVEKIEGEVDRHYREFLQRLDRAGMIERVRELKGEYSEVLKAVSCQPGRKAVKIGLVGEIYMVLEPFVNLEIEKKLGRLGALVERELYLSSWLLHFFHLGRETELIEEAARPYLKSFVGGHGIDSVGNAVRFAREGTDGIVHIGPFTCMPEIIAQTIMPVVSKGEGIPIISIFFDEHSGDVGLQTRLEAFVDLLSRKKKIREGEGMEKKMGKGGEGLYGRTISGC